jgi:hypothetical protein
MTTFARAQARVRRRLRALVRRSPGGERLARLRDRRVRHRTNRGLVRAWQATGCPAPPPHAVKQKTVREAARVHRLRVLVETGTFRGDMVEAMRPHFDRVVSIELGDEMYRRAAERFAGFQTVQILHGDSGVVLHQVLETLDEPALFWLDGHYSEGDTARGDVDTPILDELDHILRHHVPGHVVLVDDARLFDGTGHYPTVAQIAETVRVRRPSASVEVVNDVIRIV